MTRLPRPRLATGRRRLPRGRQQNACRLIAQAAAFHAGPRNSLHRIVGQVDNARIDLQVVIHAAAVKQDSAIGEQEQVGIERQAGKSVREMQHLPVVLCEIVDFQRHVVRIVEVLGKAGGRQRASVAQREKCGVPAPMGHRRYKRPFLSDRIEDGSVVASGKRVVVPGPARREQATVGQEGIAAAEKVEGTSVGRHQCCRMEEVVRRISRGVPNHAGEDSIRHVAKVRSVEARGAAA